MFRNTYTLIKSTNYQDILSKLKQLNVQQAHFTNGTYALEPEITVATTLAGFKHVVDADISALPLIIAINSDLSMQALGKTGYEPEEMRAKRVAQPLAETFPQHKVIVLFYDTPTPTPLYQYLAEHHITRTLHKWGYGTQENAPLIEGAELFGKVYAYPLVDDLKPVCWNMTATTQQQQQIIIADLRHQLITPERQCLFALPASLNQYQSANYIQSLTMNK